MLYLVGGCSRSGKSLLAERMGRHHRIPWFSLDALKMGLHLGMSGSPVLPDADDLDTADLMWPVVEPILDHALFDGRDYLVEGVNLRPRSVARFMRESDQPVRACFLGYPEVDLDEKARRVAAHVGPPTDWLHRTGEENVRRYLGESRELSRRLRDECAALGLSFVDTGSNFDAALRLAEHILVPDSDRPIPGPS